MRKCLTIQTVHGNFLILFQVVLLPNINFSTSKQKKPKAPKIDPSMLKQ